MQRTEVVMAESFVESWADRAGHRIRVREHSGPGPVVVLMHGFPDDLHLYDRMLPYLVGTRRVVTFDFLGWGGSDKPAGYPYTAHNQTGDLDAVLAHVGADPVVLVAHDASGPPAIDWALAHPERVAGLVLLNTYYGWMPRMRAPEAITLYSLPGVRNLARAVMRRFEGLDRRLYFWQVGGFIRDADVRAELLPQLYAPFRGSRPAFWRLNADLLRTLLTRRRRAAQLREFRRPVRIVFGAQDPYLNVHVARRFAELFPHAELELVRGARHYVQVDEPQQVAAAVLRAAAGSLS
jgi:pimeloyl-ACP methyl ester carboxylesterase